ncbi:MAG: M20/M25/M40 family metallo-hydrolase, partial [Alphaproteobacteria bacterium]|nr:M20/M25/M40 family metallo-hydrolase [Alphaproteobacteria bacterium]
MRIDHTNFDAESILDGILAWARIESPTYHTEGVNAVMTLAANELSAMGAQVARRPGADGYGDIATATFGHGTEPATPGILVLSRLDTVHELGTIDGPLPIRRDGDKQFGPGVLDMKGGARLAIEAYKAVRHSGVSPRLPITFMFTPDEEVGSPSARQAIEDEAQKNRFVLVPEPLRPSGDVVVGRHAIQRFRVRTVGKPSHAGLNKRDGRSAIAQMAQTIQDIEALNDYGREMTYAIGTVHGGTFVNGVAIDCSAEVLCVAPSDDRLETVRANMHALAGEANGVRIEIEQLVHRPIAP